VQDVFDSEEEPNFAAFSVDELHKLGAQYGLKKDTKARLVSMLQSMWRRLRGLPTYSQSQVALVSSQRADSRKKGKRDAEAEAAGAAPTQQSKKSCVQKRSHATDTTAQASTVATASDVPAQVAPSKPKSSKAKSASNSSGSSACSISAAVETQPPPPLPQPPPQPQMELTEQVVTYIRSHCDLFEQVITYKSVDLDTLHSRMSIDLGIKINKTTLRDTLDELAVFVSTGSQASIASKRKKQTQDLLQKTSKRVALSQNID
jgi:hypothetical protein